MFGADAEEDDGIRQRNHRLSPPKRGERILAVAGVMPPGDDVAARSKDHAMRLRRDAQGSIAARSAGPDERELVATNEDLGDDHRAALGQPLGERVDQDELLVRIEHVGEPGAIEADAAGQPFARRVGDEVDLGELDGLRVARLAKHEAKARADGADHCGRRMPERTTHVRRT